MNTSFKLEQPDYLQLTPTGSFPHPRGLQQVDTAALQALVKNFNSFLARLGRRFAGIPFYIGHPDMPGYENIYPDRKAYGWIMELEAREEGLYGRPKWSQAGRELIENGHYKFLSPYWEALQIGTQNGKPIMRPTRLISVGLTNDPNIPVLPLANNTEAESISLAGLTLPIGGDGQSETQNPEAESSPSALPLDPVAVEVTRLASDSAAAPKNESQPQFAAAISPTEHQNSGGVGFNVAHRDHHVWAPVPEDLGSPNANSECQIESRLRALENSLSAILENAKSHILPSDFEQRLATLENANRDLSEKFEILNPKSQIAAYFGELETALALLNTRLINSVLNHAVSEARILPCDRAYWRSALEADFDTASAALANAQYKLNTPATGKTAALPIITTPQLSNSGFKRDANPVNTPCNNPRVLAILRLVNERMRSTGATYHQAWTETKSEHPNLFA